MEKKAKRKLCTNCAKWHHGGARECKTLVCARCDLGHGLKEACGLARMRFMQAGLLPDNIREAPSAEPSNYIHNFNQVMENLDANGAAAMAELINSNTVSQVLLNLDSNGVRVMSQLLNHMGKRKAEANMSTETQRPAKKAKKEEPRNSSQKPNSESSRRQPDRPSSGGRSRGGPRDTSIYSRR
jgi:hypothetical protein